MQGMNKKKICIDARMALNAGIGTYIRKLLPFIKRSSLSLQVLVLYPVLKNGPNLERMI